MSSYVSLMCGSLLSFRRLSKEITDVEENIPNVVKFRAEVDVQKLHRNSPRMQYYDQSDAYNQYNFAENEFFLRIELYYAQPPQHNFNPNFPYNTDDLPFYHSLKMI